MYTFFKWMFSLLLIFIGVALVLRNLDIISLEIFDEIWGAWPLLVVLFGMISFIHSFQPHKLGSWKIGSFLMIFGGLLFAGNYDYIDFKFWDIWHLWPLIIVYIGASMLFENKGINVEVNMPKKDKKNEESVATYQQKEERSNNFTEDEKKIKVKYAQKSNQLIADRNFSRDNWEVQSMSLKTGIGNLYFDFSKAYIPDQESKIVLKGYIADIQMKIPEEIPVKIYSKVSIGETRVGDEDQSGFGNSIAYQTEGYDQATRKLNIVMNYQIGDIQVVFV
ncbi:MULTISPECIES: cell wall-active antibiotics response protein LiaF [Allobacillus]|uniref:Cell wall-active antibiotics response LiaF-like C-terminal domain-containing protein n=1 Tax=Allobacillus salarius TaxID=1955272 RepID=A0A556PNT0_9BACI|nr:cell wall-active antibiotics response protein LiaF [Allobacillus salarius]TSJ66037.1 hypothetical protein FPQ13_05585 [Allobacillus salarius]